MLVKRFINRLSIICAGLMFLLSVSAFSDIKGVPWIYGDSSSTFVKPLGSNVQSATGLGTSSNYKFVPINTSESWYLNGWCTQSSCPSSSSPYYRADAFVGGDLGFGAIGLVNDYVRSEGNYKVKLYVCVGVTTSCSIKMATMSFVSTKSAMLNPLEKITDQNPDFGGSNSQLIDVSSGISGCLVLVDSQDDEWNGALTGNTIECQDAPNKLSPAPSTCAVNYAKDLNIDFGVIERSKIQSQIDVASALEKEVNVNCTGNTSLTFSITLQQNGSFSIGGNDVIQTSINDIGVAVLYNGQVLNNNESSPPSFDVSEGNFILGFQPVLKPGASSKDVATGDFTASAVLVLNQI